MRTDFSMFRARLAEACRARDITENRLAASIGLSPRRAIVMSLSDPVSLDLYRVCQIADALDVSVDWLVGRTNVMEVMEMPELAKRKAGET
jgi:hypothetical protein